VPPSKALRRSTMRSAPPHKDVQLKAIHALEKKRASAAIPRIVAIVNDAGADKGLRNAAIGFLGKMKVLAPLAPLTAATKDKDVDIRVSAVEALGKTGQPAALEPISAALKDTEWRVRINAVTVLDRMGGPKVVEPLLLALRDESEYVRLGAAKALGNVKSAAVITALIGALADPNSFVKESAANSLEKLTGQHFGKDTAAWRKWWEQNRQTFTLPT
jgi:bilin biosynthesis protein